jgi:hypothetical protein
MKKTILLLLVAAMTMGANAQQTNSKSKITGYGAAFTELTWVNGNTAMNIGAYGGVLINHKLLIGASGNNVFFKQTVNGKKENMQLNYYGLYTEYRIQPQQPVHFSIGLTGALGWHENELINTQKRNRKDGDFVPVIQPRLAVNVKLTKFMQVQAFGSYRFTGNTNSTYYTEKNHNGVSAGASLVFGGF